MSAVDRIQELLRARGRPGLPWKVVRKRDRRGLKRDYLTSRFGFVVNPTYGDLNIPEDGELIVLLVNNAKALCDLADAARRLDVVDMGERRVAVLAIDEVRAALARLDGEDDR